MEQIHLTPKSKIINYLPLPKGILDLPLSSTAMVLYALLLGRATLSQRNNYTDGTGWIYVVYPIEDLAEVLRTSGTTVKECLRRLESHGLVRRVRRCRQQANQLFLSLPRDSVSDTLTDGKPTGDRRKTVPLTDRKPSPNKLIEQTDRKNCYQHKEEESL